MTDPISPGEKLRDPDGNAWTVDCIWWDGYERLYVLTGDHAVQSLMPADVVEGHYIRMEGN